MNINEWLNKFKCGWEGKNIDDVLSLFSADVVYYENPFHRLSGLDEIKKEWMAIMDQNEIDLSYNIFSKDDNKYAVQWDLKYSDKERNRFHFSGVYLIKLNKMELCNEFRHYCEKG